MNSDRRLARGADVVVFNKGGRDFRLDRMADGEEVPREFFYGFFALERAGIRAAMMPFAGVSPGPVGALADFLERGFAYLTGLGVRPISTRLKTSTIDGPRVLMSYTDGLSLSLGLAFRRAADRPILVCGFHGLADTEERVRAVARPLARLIIRRCLAGLDHLFFFGPADRDEAIRRYALPPERCSIIRFGVDTDFWRPLPHEKQEDFVVAVGQDRSRDYELLVRAPGKHQIVIVTGRQVDTPRDADHVRITSGDFFGTESMSDVSLRALYNRARAVIVPLKDVFQPSGYSVTLQAMSCGRPVVLSNIKGLWAHDILKHDENCLLVPPGDADALGHAIARLKQEPGLAERIGRAGRETALAHFALDKIEQGTVALANRGLALANGHAKRSA